jgi:hypothetical protein
MAVQQAILYGAAELQASALLWHAGQHACLVCARSTEQRLYVHVICTGQKTEVFKGLGLYFLNELDPAYQVTAGSGPHVRLWSQTSRASRATLTRGAPAGPLGLPVGERERHRCGGPAVRRWA